MNKNFSYTRRSFLVTLFNLLIFFVIGIRLFFLQIIKSKEFRTLSHKNSIKLIFLEPKRGKIFDRTGVPLATNVNNYKLILYKQRDHNHLEILNELFKIITLSKKEQKNIIKNVTQARLISPTIIKENLPWEEVARIESESHRLPGVFIDKGYKRYYPQNNLFSHILGYMGLVSPQEISSYNLFHSPDFKVGKAGIEKTKQQSLMGKFGMKQVEVNAYRKVVRNLDEIKSIAGEDIRLTVNSIIQAYVSNALQDKNAASIILDIHTGQVLSMVSTPSFNPNSFSTGMSYNEWNEIISNPSYPLTNKTIGKLYPPGSIWKIIVALAILESGVDPSEEVNCQGFVKIGNKKFKCWKATGHGHVNLTKALMSSCNPYFFEMSQKIGIQQIHQIAEKFGFGNKTGIDLPGELTGINPNKEWKRKTFHSEWFIGDTANASIGQGYILATPLQMATMVARLASGLATIPSVIYSHNNMFKNLDIDPKNLALVRNGLNKTFNTPGGTGYLNRIKEKKYQMAAKTGTAQVISRDTSRDPQNKFAKHLKSHSLFTGFAPVHNPKYAAALVIDHGGWGSKTAAPLGRDILYFAQKTLSKS